jgi:hypothetical protein
MQLTTGRRFDVAVSDQRIDLSKARRVELAGPAAPLPLPRPATNPPARRNLAELTANRDGLRFDPGQAKP